MRRLLIILFVHLSAVVNAVADTEVRGTLPNDALWSRADSPYVATQNIEIPKGGRLRIESGVQIRMGSFSLFVAGTLEAIGTKELPIVFTANSTTPRPGAWGRIQFQPTSTAGKVDEDGKYQSGSVLDYCTIEYGSGILIDRSSPCLLNCNIQYHVGENAGAIFINAGKPLIRSNRITHNQSKRDGGGIRSIACSPVIEQNAISFNHAQFAGGGIATDMNPSTIRGNVIEHNSANTGGGIATGITALGQSYMSGTDRSSPVLEDNVIRHNAAVDSGGGVYILGIATVRNNRILNNRLCYALAENRGRDNLAAEEFRRPLRGAGILIEETHGGQAELENNLIVGNRGARWGGGLFLTRAGAVLRHNRIVANEAQGGGGVAAVLTRAGTSLGGKKRGDAFLFENNEITDNAGGGLEFSGAGPQVVTIRSCNLDGNTPRVVTNYSGLPVQAAPNWWGEGRVSDRIHDFFVDNRLGKVEYGEPASKSIAIAKLPAFTAEERNLAVSMPQELRGGLSAQEENQQGVTVGLAWRAPAIDGIVRYRVYISSEVPCGSEGTIPLKQAAAETKETKLRVSGLARQKRYFFTVTGFDAQGRETGFAEPIAIWTQR